jgi:hypothetical protein
MLATAAMVASIAGLPSRAVAWGPEGHELVGKIADKFINNNTRNAINELLENHQFQSLSDGRLPNWADSIKSSAAYRRKYPTMNLWHYIDIDVNADLANLNLDDFCPNGDCALNKLKKWQEILKDGSKPLQDRREALFFIAHVVGDIHQPLHCAERNKDRGGNLVRVQLPNDDHVTNLHSVWDGNLVREAMGPLSKADYAARLANTLSTDKRKQYQQGKLEDWIIESHKLAREKAYKGIPIQTDGGAPFALTSAYILQGAETVEEQLIKGGVRLARFLDDTFQAQD